MGRFQAGVAFLAWIMKNKANEGLASARRLQPNPEASSKSPPCKSSVAWVGRGALASRRTQLATQRLRAPYVQEHCRHGWTGLSRRTDMLQPIHRGTPCAQVATLTMLRMQLQPVLHCSSLYALVDGKSRRYAMIPAFGMVLLPQNPSTGNGQVPGCSSGHS